MTTIDDDEDFTDDRELADAALRERDDVDEENNNSDTSSSTASSPSSTADWKAMEDFLTNHKHKMKSIGNLRSLP
jgi:hypothetical protein